jgi:hypothetical protein
MKIEVIGPRTGKYTGDLLSAAPAFKNPDWMLTAPAPVSQAA